MTATYAQCQTLVEEALHHCLPESTGYAKVLKESAHYSLLAGGKRLRPCLVLMAANHMGVDVDQAMPYACAMEMIHTYSLIHDDLPAMDNDTLRRGNPTNHVVYGQAMAILAGDALLTHAFSHMLENALRYPARANAHMRAALAVAKAAGMDGMVAGQSVDVYCEKQGVDAGNEKGQLDYIHLNKTAALISGSLLAGIELGDPDDATRRAFTIYGEKLGVAFQIADDLLDACATTEQMGKTVGKDAAEGKLTYVALYGLETSRAKLEQLTHEAMSAIAPIDHEGYFAALAVELLGRKN